MAVKITKPEINVREKLSELDKPSGIAGEAMLRAETPQEQQALIGVGRRNLVINGDFRIAQRATSSTLSDYQTVDRWRSTNGSSPNGTMHQAQTTDGPANEGHAYSYKYTSTSSTSSVPTGSDPWIKYEVASEDLTNLQLYDWKKELTLSFWIKTNQPGQHSISLNSGNFSGANYTVAYNIDSTEWQKVIVTYPAPPIDLPSGNVGLRLYWSLGAGATYQVPLADTNRWQTGQGKYEAAGNKRIAGINNAFVQIAGVQLELGKVATPFEHRSYGEELALCERYCQTYTGTDQEWIYIEGSQYNHKWWQINLKTPMRSDPSVTFPSVSAAITGGAGTITSLSTVSTSPNRISVRCACSANGGNPYELRHTDGFDGLTYIMSAEL
jgi:hypothetical protein